MRRFFPGSSRHAGSQSGMALMPIVMTIAIIGALIGAGLNLIGPVTQRLKTETARSRMADASRSVIAWSIANGRLPTAAEFADASGVRNDSWNRAFVYGYDGNLATSAGGGLCGRESTSINAGGSADAAFFIVSGSSDLTVDSTPAVSGAYAGNATLSSMDLVEVVFLADLRNRAGCFDRTAGRLTLLNNELPDGCNGQAYSGDLFAEGGAGAYTWSTTSQPAWMTLTPAGDACHLSGSPASPGAYTVDVTLADAGGTPVRRWFDITVATCAGGPSPVSSWDFDEGAGPTARDGIGGNDGTLVGDTTWSTDTPDTGGTSLSFDGSGDYVRVFDHSSLHITGQLTLMAWVKETATGSFAKVISRRTGYYFYFLGVDNGRPYGGIGDDVDWAVTGKSLLMSLDHWNHLAFVYDDDIDRMFLHFDGTERITSTPLQLPARNGVNLAIGGDSQGHGGGFNGDIDDVAIFDRALTDEEIRGILNGAGHPDRVAGYGFDGNLEDLGTGGHDGTLAGAVYTSDRHEIPNRALRLDGGDRVLVADHPDFELTGGLTLTAWIRERASRPHGRIVSRHRGNYFYFLGVDNGRPYGGIGDGHHTAMTRGSIAMISDQWHFVAFVYDDATDRMQIYFNGTLDETTVTVSLPDVSGVDLTIGADYEGTGHFFTGLIDQAAVYDQALTSDEIMEAY